MDTTLRARLLRNLPVPLLATAAIAILIAAGASLARLTMSPAAIPFPIPIYEIEAQSGGCNASILNLGIGYVGSLEVPVPVDVDCDLLPDILVAVNLVDIEGPINDPLATDSTTYWEFIQERGAATIAPNIEFNRYPVNLLSTILQQPSPPLRINIVLTLTDLEGEEPDTEIRFGYDTGQGGSIPGNFKALVRGLDTFFNPLEAVVDTKGDLQGGDTVPTYYEGPLTLIGGIRTDEGAFDTSLELEYSPWPDVVRVGYASDDAGHHIDYEHGIGELLLLGYGTVLAEDGTFEHYIPGELPEIDVETRMSVLDHADTMDLTANIDRMPRQLGIDLKTTPDGSGRIDWAATTDGRLPDARVDLVSRTNDIVTTRAQAWIEELPPELHALWSLGEENAIEALFATTDPDAPEFDLDNLGEGPGIGAIEVLYSNVEQTSFAPHIPTQQQFVNIQAIGDEQLASARVERIRGMKFSSTADGIDVNARIGDGALPLEANVEIDGLPVDEPDPDPSASPSGEPSPSPSPAPDVPGRRLDANATLFPLPSAIDLAMVTPEEGSPDPFQIVLDSSHTIDIQAHAELREPYAMTALCGEPGTLCADVGVHHVPAHIAVSMAELETAEGDGSTTDINIDLVPRPGAPKPDVLIDAVMGKDDSLDDPDAVDAAGPVVFEASAELRGIPENIRIHFEEGSDETMSALDLSTCDLTANETCLGVSDPIDSVEVLVRNFREDERAQAGVPHPSSVAPQYATVAARGLDDPEKEDDPVVRFEAAGRIKDITEIRYANVEGLFGIRSVIGDNRDLEVVLDIENVIFGGDEETTGPSEGPSAEPSEEPSPGPGEEEEELGPIDLLGRVLVSPLPGEIDLCLREAGKDLALAHPAPFTDICESGDPFGDESVTETPMTLAYDANTPFDVLANVDFTAHGEDPGVEDNHDIHAKIDITQVPSDLVAHIQMPPDVEEGEETPETERMRILAYAPGANNTNITYTFQDRLAGALCADPQPVGNITCIEGTINGLPEWTSVLVDTVPDSDDVAAKVFACDLLIATDHDCRPGTDGDIDEITARARMVSGNPFEEGDLVPFVLEEHPYVDDFTRDTAHLLALRMDQDDSDNMELTAEAVLTDFRSITFGKTADSFNVRTDLGDGVKPLLASVGMDTRFPDSAVPAPDCEDDEETEEDECAQPEPGDLLFADARVLPLPEVITISQSGPVDDDDETVADESQPMEIDFTSNEPEVDVEARLQQFGQVAGPLCGDHGTLCATLQIDRLPSTISATIDEFDEGLGGSDVRRMMTVDIDAIPFGGVDPADMVIDAMIGAAPDEVPPIEHDDTPLIAHAEINGFLEEAGIYFGQTGELLDDGSLKDAELEQVGFVSCELDFDVSPPACTTTPTPIREVGVAVRNFHERPTDFPVPTRTNTPAEDTLDCDPNNLNDDPGTSELMYAEAVMRGDDLEAHAGFTCINEFRMISVDDVLGVDVRAGDGQGLEVHGDIAGMTLGDDKPISDEEEVELGFAEDLEAAEDITVLKRQTLTADVLATLSNVPTHVSFCMRSDGAEFPDGPIGTAFTEPCEDQHPFADDDPDDDEDFFEAAPPEDAPMSVAYRANDVIDDITTVATVRIDRALFIPIEILGNEILIPAGSLPPMNLFADVNIEKLPENLTVHFETPAENEDDEAPMDEGGPIRALFYYDDSDSFGAGTDLVNIDFNAKYTLGNAVCRDLRDGKVAYCFKGRLENLPARVKAYIDPEAELFDGESGDLTQNLRIDAFSEVAPTDSLNLTGLDISVVKDDDPTKEPLILVATGAITGLPQSIRGTIHMEEEAAEGEPDPNDAPAFLVEASPPLEHLDVVVRNFIAPDPLPDVAAPRADRFGNAHDPDQEIIFIGRGPDFKAIVDIRDVSGGGYRTGRNAAGEATETHLINVGFGIPGTSEKPTIRAYVDMLDRDDEGNPTAIFGEVFLDDVPYGIDVCFRGEVDEIPVEPDPDDYTGGATDPDYLEDLEIYEDAVATYVDPLAAAGTESDCDTYLFDEDPDDEEPPVEVGLERHLGAFSFEGATEEDPTEQELDVDAFFRMAQGSDTNVLKAFADVDDIPNTVKGSFGDGAISVEMFKANGVTKASIGEVFAEMADYDFYDSTPDAGFNTDGYGAHPPWGFRVPGNAPLPPRQPATQDANSGPSGHEFARVAVNDDNFHVQARIGKDKDGGPGLTLTSFIMDPSICPVPSQATSYFPHYPIVDADEDGENDNAYTCIRGELLPGNGEDPLLLDADLLLDGMPLKLRDAGLTDVPQFFQITLAETATLEGPNAALRERCAPAADEGATLVDDHFEGGSTDCMPPMIHFDSEGDAQLFARLLLGEGSDSSGDLSDLRTRTPYDTMPNMEALPVPPAVRPGSDQFSQLNNNTGVLAKVGQFQDVVLNGEVFPPAVEPIGPQRTAVRAALRLDIPKALTIDQVQQWSYENRQSNANYRAMKDMRFHYVFRDSDGSDEPQIVETLGDLAVMVHDFRTGGQVLVSNDGSDTRGVPIPGDFGIDLYERDFKGRGRMMIQADVRSSTNIGARVRLYSGLVDGLGDSDFRLSGLKGFNGDDSYLEDLEKPTFRLRAEIKGEPEKVPQPGGGGGGDDGDDWKDALLCIVWCLATDVGAPQVDAQVNLAPESDNPARMLEAVISMNGTKIGAELQGYSTIDAEPGDPIGHAPFSADSGSSGLAPFSTGGISVDISPLNVFLHAGVPILASFDMLLLSEGKADINIAPTDNFRLRLNTLVLKARTDDDFSYIGGADSWLQIGLFPGFLQAYLSIFWPFPPVYLNYGITAGPAITVVFQLCSPVPANIPQWTLPLNESELLVNGFLPAPWLSIGGYPAGVPSTPLFTYGTLKPILDPVIWGLGPSILCLALQGGLDDISLFTDYQPHEPHDDRSPGDPIVQAGHPVPGLNVSGPPDAADPHPTCTDTIDNDGDGDIDNDDTDCQSGGSEDAGLEDLVVANGDTVSLCGTQVFRNITIQSGGTVNVASSANDDAGTPFVDCPEDPPAPTDPDEPDPLPNEGHLRLIAAGDPNSSEGGLTISGTLNAPSGGGDLTLAGENVTISGTVNGATGLVEVNAGLNLTVSGTIDANYVATEIPTIDDPDHDDFGQPWTNDEPTGNAGASHGGEGSTGSGKSAGSTGDVYGSGEFDGEEAFPGTETGSPGSASRSINDGDTIGKGGGAVLLRGSDVTVTGTITARGQRGDDDSSGACEVDIPDDPETEEVDESAGNHPNTGLPGTGGGSGGGIAINGITVDVSDATLRAWGGRGGDGRGGAGGAGGGGVIRLSGGVVELGSAYDGGSEQDAAVRGGGEGFSFCDDDYPDGDEADDGAFEVIESPRSVAFSQSDFWFAPGDVEIPYKAALRGGGLTVYLCGIRKGPEDLQTDRYGVVMPTGVPGAFTQCGNATGDENQPQVLATHNHTDDVVEGTFDVNGLGHGVWALWTIAATDDEDIFDFWFDNPADFCQPYFPFWNDDCVYEPTPSDYQTAIGVDDAPPAFSMSTEGLSQNADDPPKNVTSDRNITINVSGIEDKLASLTDPFPLIDDTSGFARFCVYLDDGSLDQEFCSTSEDKLEFELPSDEEEYTIYVVAFDQAGNPSSPLDGGVPDVDAFDNAHRVVLTLDTTAPDAGDADITAPATPDGNNDWYLSPPTEYTIDGFDDFGGSGPHPDGAFLYWFDAADPEACEDPCVLTAADGLPGEGAHTLNWRARDAAGHLVPPESEPPNSIPIMIDSSTPESAVSVVPVPEFTGQWITADEPVAVARGVDIFGGSDLEGSILDSDCDAADPAATERSGTCISIDGTGGPWQAWDGTPVALPNGTGQVICAFSVDDAGNVEAVNANVNCTEPLNIDNALPTGLKTINPDLAGAWYDFDQGVPAITFHTYDGTGSPEPGVGGFRYRLDNGPEVSCADPCSIPTSELSAGSNVLHWTVVDTAGNRRSEERVELFIDLDFPRSYVLPAPWAPTGSNDWYLEKTAITLAAFDQVNPSGPNAPPPPLRPTESGIDAINYTLDGDPFTYTSPFHIEVGEHVLCVNAVDVAGNDQETLEREDECQTFKVDLERPDTTIFENGLNPPTIDGANGWYRNSPVVITTTASDEVNGSNVVPQNFGPNLCDHAPDGNPAPAGICISVDGRAPGVGIHGPEFGPYDGRTPITLGEGEHVIRAYSVDNAGRRSAMEREIVKIDRSDPVTVARLRAPYASRDGIQRDWWRHQPSLVLRGVDGDHNSGIELIQYRINGGTTQTYTGPVTMPIGKNWVEHRAKDLSGRFSPWVRKDVAVDVTPPFIKATSPDPALWIWLKILGLIELGDDTAELKWKLSDDLSGPVHVKVIVYDQFGLAVRHLDAGIHNVTPGQIYNGSTEWDGYIDAPLEKLASAGIHYYRVIAYDDAGNVAMSGESKKLQIKLKVCLLFC